MASVRRCNVTVLSIATLALSAAAGCTSYYRVTDPDGGKQYYTTDIDRERRGSAVRFKDARTKAEITLTSSEIEKIEKKAFKAAVEAK